MSNKKSSSTTNDKVFSYKDSGVDVQAGDDFVDWIHSEEKSTKKEDLPHQGSVIEGVGGFASLFRLNTKNYAKPCLVTCTDGVGTKVKLAADFDLYAGIGQDLVAMCVNDLLCTGGDPLLFLDYLAVGKLDLEQAKKILTSIRKACRESDLALVGGETAEMPGIYKVPEFDCAGFAVGIVDEDRRLGAHLVRDSDVLVGISSSGFHSNGYSLLRKVFAEEIQNQDLKLVQELMVPTKLYVSIIKQIKEKFSIHALAHITGGGMENVPRVIPKDLVAKISPWEFPSLFQEVQRRTALTTKEMMNTLNCGVGMVVVLPNSEAHELIRFLEIKGEKAFKLGAVSLRTPQDTEDWVYVN
ncbi:MAG: phosphoribosylformylglycinamidine cyclo-ligase [Bdellovibrionaceae bacterium]|nr:phosphoribosylformylglycinamidine cyclo-ligase [Pseudobdellovibrionaceae bacterium]